MTSHLKEIKEHIDHSMNQLRAIISDNRNDNKLKGIIFPGISDYRDDSKSHNPGKGKTFDLTQYGLGKTFYIGSHGVLLGTGIAKYDWSEKEWLQLMKYLNKWYRYFYDNHKDKFFVGDIRPPPEGDNKTKLIRIFGANTGNWNQKEGSQIYGGGQARVIGKQTKYVFGILTMNEKLRNSQMRKSIHSFYPFLKTSKK